MVLSRCMTLMLAGATVAMGAQPPSMDALIAAVRSKDAVKRTIALSEIRRLGPEAAPAVPTLISLLKQQGRQGPDTDQAVNALVAIGAPAAPSLPLLVEFSCAVGRLDGQAIFSAVDTIARAVGPENLGLMLDATARVARRIDRQFKSDGPSVWEYMADPRDAFNPARRDWGKAALPALRDALAQGDEYVMAEAAGWIDALHRHSDVPLPWLAETLPWLEDARSRVKTVWPRYQLDLTIENIQRGAVAAFSRSHTQPRSDPSHPPRGARL